jgi:hypothetical protein
MLAVPVAALVLAAGAPPPARAQQAHRLIVADHVALAKTGAGRQAWTQKTIAHTRAALRHLRPYR